MCSIDSIYEYLKGCRASDPDNNRWGECLGGDGTSDGDQSVIKKAIRETVFFIFGLRPDYFSITKTVTLEEGCYQSICDSGCQTLLSIDILDGDGCNPIEQESSSRKRRSMDFLKCYDIETCFECKGDGLPNTYKLNDYIPCKFRLDKPITTPIDAMVTCIPSFTDLKDDDDLPDAICSSVWTAVIDGTLARLYGLDTNSSTLPALASTHFASMSALLKGQSLWDLSIKKSDFFLGKETD